MADHDPDTDADDNSVDRTAPDVEATHSSGAADGGTGADDAASADDTVSTNDAGSADDAASLDETVSADDAASADDATSPDDPPLPAEVVDRAVTLTRRMRRAVDDNERAAYRQDRERLLGRHEYVARVREDDTGATLVCYPADWVEDGVVQVASIEDTDRAVERSLSGVGSADYEVVETHNRAVAERVADRHGDPHGATAHAFADFMSNHYRKRVEAATEAERREFREEYFPRNAWPTDAQRDAVAESLRLVDEAAAEK